jgi:hypothetical protein
MEVSGRRASDGKGQVGRSAVKGARIPALCEFSASEGSVRDIELHLRATSVSNAEIRERMRAVRFCLWRDKPGAR